MMVQGDVNERCGQSPVLDQPGPRLTMIQSKVLTFQFPQVIILRDQPVVQSGLRHNQCESPYVMEQSGIVSLFGARSERLGELLRCERASEIVMPRTPDRFPGPGTPQEFRHAESEQEAGNPRGTEENKRLRNGMDSAACAEEGGVG